MNRHPAVKLCSIPTLCDHFGLIGEIVRRNRVRELRRRRRQQRRVHFARIGRELIESNLPR